MTEQILTKSYTAIEVTADFPNLHRAFSEALRNAFEKRDIQTMRNVYESFTANTDHDKKSPMDQAFRELLLFVLKDDVNGVGALVKLSVEAVRAEIASVTIPVVLLADIFDTVTLDMCENIFNFVEEMVDIWKEEVFFSSCKNNILRMCNDLLRRLSRAQNTVFCGRILLFLSKFFPFSERSGLNIVSEFNLENVTEYGVDSKDLDDPLQDTIEEIPIKIDYNLYCKFWSLQDFFRNPNQCYSNAHWKMFQAHSTSVLEAFSSFKLEETRLNNQKDATNGSDTMETMKMDTDSNDKTDVDFTDRKDEQYFAKFLTNPKLLALQLSDSNFRRAILVQFLILFQYLQLTVKFKSESNTLNPKQLEFVKESEGRIYKLLQETPPRGKRFANTVRHMLKREEIWNSWKNDGCKEFKKPEEGEGDGATAAKRARRPIAECLREAGKTNKFYLGNDNLNRLWNYSPDNLQACKSEERNFLPPLDTYLDNPREKSDPSFEWRALRLLARQSPHFFTFPNSSSYKIADFLECVWKRLLRDKLEMAKASVFAVPANVAPARNSIAISSEQENVSIQDGDQDDDIDEVVDDQTELEPSTSIEDDKNTHSKPMTATPEQMAQVAPLIGENWKKLGKKLGYTTDELLYFETEHKDRHGGCIAMLSNWFNDDDDASLDNWAYILEGLDLNEAAAAVKAMIEKLETNGNTNDDDVEVLSD